MGVPGKKHNILQRNLYVLLTSDEMVAQSCLLAIVYISCMLPLWWLAGKTHTLCKYNWGERSMGRALDLFRTKLLQLHETPKLFLSKMFMMMLFTELEDDLPTFKEYWQHLYCKRKMKVVGCKTGTTVMGLAKSKYLIFHAENATNIACTTRLLDMEPVWSGSILAKFDNKKQAIYCNLLISD